MAFGALALSLLAVAPLVGQDQRTARLALSTLWLAGATVAVSVPVGAVLALALVRTEIPARRGFGILLAGLLFVPLYVQAAAWQAGLGAKGWLILSGAEPLLLEGRYAAVWVYSAAAIPWVVLIVAGGMCFVERELEEEALLNTGAGRVFRQVAMRRGWAAIGAAALWVGVTTAGDTTVCSLFQVHSYAEQLYNDVAIGREPGQAALGALPGMIVCAWLVLAAALLAVRLAPLAKFGGVRRPLVYRLGRWRWLAAILAAAMVALLLGVPLASLAWKAGVLVTQSDEGRLRHWSVTKFLSIVTGSPARYERPLGWSLAIGSLAAAAAVTAALALIWPARRGGWRLAPAVGLTALGLALPGPVVGLGLIWLMNRPHMTWLTWLYDHSIMAPWAAQTLRAFPLAALVLWPAVRSIPSERLESAALEGAGFWTSFWRVLVPARLPALAIAWLVALMAALGELGASILVVPPGVETLSIHIFGLLHGGYEDEVAGICLALFVAFELSALAIWCLAARWYTVGRAILLARQE